MPSRNSIRKQSATTRIWPGPTFCSSRTCATSTTCVIGSSPLVRLDFFDRPFASARRFGPFWRGPGHCIGRNALSKLSRRAGRPITAGEASMRLGDKIALVTGAASGFGAEIARSFAREGAKVAIFDLNGDGAQAVANAIGPAATAFPGDVTNASDVRSCVERLVATHGRLDIVVNNAGW